MSGCLILLKRRLRRRKQIASSESGTRTLLIIEDDDDKPPPFKKPFDIENPAPVHLEKSKASAFPHLKTLHLLSRPGSNTSSMSIKKDSTNPRIYITQPAIPVTSCIYYKHDTSQPVEASPNKRLKAASMQTLPDGFESFIYSLRSPQATIEASMAKRLSALSAISSIRFARDSQGWVPRRASLNSIGHSTVFDDGTSISPSPPGKDDLASHQKRHSHKSLRGRLSRPQRRGSPVPSPLQAKFEDIEEEVTYQPTPLAPPPAQIRSRSATPNASMLEYSIRTEGSSIDYGRRRGLQRPPGLEVPVIGAAAQRQDVAVKGGSMSILHSAIAKGKVSRQEAENVIGMRLVLTP